MPWSGWYIQSFLFLLISVQTEQAEDETNGENVEYYKNIEENNTINIYTNERSQVFFSAHILQHCPRRTWNDFEGGWNYFIMGMI